MSHITSQYFYKKCWLKVMAKGDGYKQSDEVVLLL